MKIDLDDVIVACATKISKQAISIVRLSGDDSIKIVNKILKKDLELKNKFQLRKIYDKNNLIDESLILTFIGNKSFTGQTVVEINCHGGILLTNKIISLLIENGARLAKPGEFSQRAYLNGKINLLQAEGINNLIESKNELSLKINALNLEGSSNKKILDLKEKIIDLISKIQTSIDYPDYDDIEGASIQEIKISLKKIENIIFKTIEISKRINTINHGIKTLILGETNVGKSSLLNSLLNDEKAIVTDIEGTTRDIVEGTINFENFTLDLIDSAGIRETNDIVEKIGVKKTISLINNSELIFFIINYDKINMELYDLIKEKKHIVVLNKVETLSTSQINEVEKKFKDIVKISALTNNIEELLTKIEKDFNDSELLENDLPMLTNLYHIEQFKEIFNLIRISLENLEAGFSSELINIELYEILKIINNLLGIFDADDEVIDNIFRKYCLGK
ncbi:tRNA modification GTPase TrmE [Spiroplasma taiwanense CT-1]|uniref:tRNA modification GTPase MnmE n=1 Tax=Spiroplasma taiwanense CT-1 TaxID=1276220 RepID=S5LV80_9MOLU|nr:tRNA uridine-5-carboxymethylaminomethyl(34) synthesis GTPase MnmE [Spiroplasma taiwanense]AGR41684.1 tRNA modification GTPase TrmE [Spiroplasma taiwanense CT-1]